MNTRIVQRILAAGLVLASLSAQGEDIDLFVGSPPPDARDLPSVLFIIDNTANWSTPFANEIAAISRTLRGLPVNADGSAKINVGIMISTETGNPNNNVKGGYVRAAMRPMTATNRDLYATMVENLDRNRDAGDGGYAATTMAEAYLYFTGGTPYAGNGKVKTDYTGNTCHECAAQLSDANKAANRAIWALPGNAISSKNGSPYNNAFSSGCAGNFIIYISNGPNQENSSSETLANNMLRDAGGDTTRIRLSPSGSESSPLDEWARFMHEGTLGVRVYTIDVNFDASQQSGQRAGWSALLKSVSGVSKGDYTAVSVNDQNSSATIEKAINDALSKIQSINGVFASVSLPVSVNTQGTFLNQVFVGMFRPDGDALPRWAGNLKQYKLGFSGNDLRLQDADEAGAINNITGFVAECARSFWTPTSPDNYWQFSPMGSCITPADVQIPYEWSNYPDGNVVEKGAQGHLLRGSSSRTMKTCDPAACTALQDFSTDRGYISQAVLGAASSAERTALIDWQRGINVDNEGTKGTAVIRPSAHGDVVHSRPVALNLGTDALPKVVVFYGGNDGIFRAINGNRTQNIGTASPGAELWSFVPPEFFNKIKRIRDNDIQVSYPNIAADNAQPKPYGMDGTVTAYNEGGDAWIYATMRRGGRAVYAFDVNTADPSDISLKWKIGCPNSANDTGCTNEDFRGIGQTWSAPKAFKAAGYGSGSTLSPLLIFGGGYDSCEDTDPHACSNNSTAKGSKVYVVDADTGTLLKTFNTRRSVAADVFVVPDLATGLALHAYVVDMGGNIYRIDIGEDAPASWQITPIAALGCATADGICNDNRKFMFAPDVLLEDDEYVLLLGSGDREKPLRYTAGSSVTNSVSNYFFLVRDKPGDEEWLTSERDNCGADILCLSSLLGILTNESPTTAELDSKKGWYLGMRSTEQVVTAAITIFGTVTFSTHQPTAPEDREGVCTTDLGTSRVYNVFYENAESENDTGDRSEVLPPVGLPPSPVAGMVTLDSGQTVAFCIGCDPASPLEGGEPPVPAFGSPNMPKGRVFWHIEK